MDEKIKKLEEELASANVQYKEVRSYIFKNKEMPQVDSASDSFEYWYVRGLEVALSLFKK